MRIKLKSQGAEVTQWLGLHDSIDKVKEFCGEDFYSCTVNGRGDINIRTKHQRVGQILVRSSDWLMRCSSGQYYHVRKELFEELVEDAFR